MKKKIGLLILWLLLIFSTGFVGWEFDEHDCGIGEALAGALIAIFIERGFNALQDLIDTTNWKSSQRKLQRGGFIKDSDIIRISFAYLYRIKVGNKYLLVQNARNTGKYQPVGGVYKLEGNEKRELKNHFHVMDDDKIPIDESSKNDYRLRIESRYLRKFVKRFNCKNVKRERIDNLAREFREELIQTGILNWNKVQYRVCGRNMTELKFSEHFQIYELLLADVVELIPTAEQESALQNLTDLPSEKFKFATADQITCLGMDIKAGQLYEWIGDHTKIILQENEGNLMKISETRQIYTVDLM